MFNRLLKEFIFFLFTCFGIIYFTNYALSGNDMFSLMILLLMMVSSAITFVMYGIDKWRAIRDKWRIPEKTLLTWGILGGAWGGIIAMVIFRHKIRKGYFWIVNIIGIILFIIIMAFIKGALL